MNSPSVHTQVSNEMQEQRMEGALRYGMRKKLLVFFLALSYFFQNVQ